MSAQLIKLKEAVADALATGRLLDDNFIIDGDNMGKANVDSESVDQHLKCLRPILDAPGVTEVIVHQPGSAFVETAKGWLYIDVPELTAERCNNLATCVATMTDQVVNKERPIMSATLATGERIQIVLPPVVERGFVSITLRKPSNVIYRLEDFQKQHLFDDVSLLIDNVDPASCIWASLTEDEQRLLALLRERRIMEFMREAVKRKKTIVVSGATGSGKTTFMKGIIQECPIYEHLITIEDAREIFLPRHPHKTHLLYSKGGQGLAKVTAKDLLVSCLRMKPDRILLAEVREGECYDFLRTAASGHPGSITSLHAGTCMEAFEQMGLMIRQSEAGRGFSHSEIQRLLRLLVDVVVQYVKDHKGRRVTEIYYKPLKKKALTNDD